jgi:hypothetical protein
MNDWKTLIFDFFENLSFLVTFFTILKTPWSFLMIFSEFFIFGHDGWMNGKIWADEERKNEEEVEKVAEKEMPKFLIVETSQLINLLFLKINAIHKFELVLSRCGGWGIERPE